MKDETFVERAHNMFNVIGATDDDLEVMYTVPQLAAILQVAEKTIRRWVRLGVLNAYYFAHKNPKGSHYRFRARDVKDLLLRVDTPALYMVDNLRDYAVCINCGDEVR